MTEASLEKPRMPIVIVGHVDHGKSTIVGRLLADTGSLPDGKLEQVKLQCAKTSRPFEYAFLLDALKEEQSQGITIDAARVFFSTAARRYLILDAPGHIEFLKNMVTGAAHAQAALLVIDAKEGIRENSRRHGYLLSLLGIKNLVILVNKMDLVNYDQKIFNSVVSEYKDFLKSIQVTAENFIPLSGFYGENLIRRSEHIPWYHGPTVIEALEAFPLEELDSSKAFRMPVQDVYKFTRDGDDRRIVAGMVQSGSLSIGDEIVFQPSGKVGVVKSIESFNTPRSNLVKAGWSTGFTLQEQIYVSRGQVAVKKTEPEPQVGSRFLASVFWLGKKPMTVGHEYSLKLGTAKVQIHLESINYNLNSSSLEQMDHTDKINKNEVAKCILNLQKPVCYDLDLKSLNRFVIIDDYDIVGGGIIHNPLPDSKKDYKDSIFLRNEKWETSAISEELRTKRYGQKPCVILVTGPKEADRRAFAKTLEKSLFDLGQNVYYLGMGNVIYGLDADIRGWNKANSEHIRRLAEICHIMVKAGLILVVSALDLTQDDVESISMAIEPHSVFTIWMGENTPTEIQSHSKPNIKTIIDLLYSKSILNIKESDS